MESRKVIAFRHASPLGNAPAARLFERVQVRRKFEGELYDTEDSRTSNFPPTRRFSDYAVTIDREGLPDEVEVLEIL